MKKLKKIDKPGKQNANLISVRTETGIALRSKTGSALKDLPVDEVSESLAVFVQQIQIILQRIGEVEHFPLAEISVAAEITATGKFAILGVGADASAKGGITLKFLKK